MPTLFVYGTLRPGGSNHGLLERVVSDVELAHADGLALYATRGFPYAAPDPSPHARISGTVCMISDRAWPAALTPSLPKQTRAYILRRTAKRASTHHRGSRASTGG